MTGNLGSTVMFTSCLQITTRSNLVEKYNSMMVRWTWIYVLQSTGAVSRTADDTVY